jgi:large subunit ribosomal protein L4
VFGESNNNVYLSSRNLKASKVLIASELNTYGILNTKKLVLAESSIAVIEDNLSK